MSGSGSGGSDWAGAPLTEDQYGYVLASIVESSEDAILAKTLDGVVRIWNRAAERLYGYSADEVLGQSVALIMPEDRPDELPSILERLRRGERIAHYETERVRRDGSRVPISLTVSPIFDPAGGIMGASAIAREISERRRAEAERERLLEEARAASEAKSTFLASVSHELRTPLNAIIGHAELLRDGVIEEIGERTRTQIERVLMSAYHLLQMVEEILAFGRTEGRAVELDSGTAELLPILNEVRTTFEPLARERKLELLMPEHVEPPSIRTDPRKLRQVLTNLVGNALKFTREGSVIVEVERLNGMVEFRIVDTGPGIPDEDLERMFEPFWQGDQSLTRTSGGTGLGLAIVKRYVEAMHGTVHVHSVVGDGATFAVRLPVE